MLSYLLLDNTSHELMHGCSGLDPMTCLSKFDNHEHVSLSCLIITGGENTYLFHSQHKAALSDLYVQQETEDKERKQSTR